MARGRVALVIIDGLGDVSVPLFGGRTPLQVAHTPHLDAIAAAGANGLMDPVEPGLACGSDTSHMALLGYDPRRHYRGRGAFEALGAGLGVAEGDVAFKCNFATLDPSTGLVIRRRADRDFEHEGPLLCAALDGLELDARRFPGCGVEVRYATEHRCGVVVRRRRRIGGEGGEEKAGGTDLALSDAITGTDPLRDGLPLLRCEPVVQKAAEEEEEAGQEDDEERQRQQQQQQQQQQFTCDLVNHVSDRMREVLEAHPINAERRAQGKSPANVVLLRGAGARLSGLQPFGEALARRLRREQSDDGRPTAVPPPPLRACMVAPTKIIAGVGITFGIDVLPAAGATGDYRSDLAAKAAAVAAALNPLAASPSPSSSYDLALLHVKAVDDAGHDRAVALKVRLLEAVDAMVGQLLARLRAAERAQEEQAAAQQQRARRREGGGDQGEDDEDDPRCVYAVCVTGDHSTPVVFGDHSHEPVPFAVARVRDAVEALRGGGCSAAAASTPTTITATYPPIPMPDPHAPPPPASEMLRQLRQQEARHAAAERGEAFPLAAEGAESGGGGRPGDRDSFGPWPEPWPSRAQARYDGALRFDELTAGSKGGLGRFPGSEAMGLLAPFLGRRREERR